MCAVRVEQQRLEVPAREAVFALASLLARLRGTLYCKRGDRAVGTSNGQRRRRLGRRPEDPGELAALQQLAALAAAAGHLVLAGADGLFGAARGFDRQQIAVAGRRDRAEHPVLVAQLDEQHALARARQEVHLVGLAEDAARLGGRGDQHFAAGEPRDVDDLGAFRRPRVAAAGARARLDEAVEVEAQRVAVARHRDGVHRRRRRPSFFGADVAGDARVEAHRGDDLLAVLQLELLLDRLAVAGRRRHVDDLAGVGDAEVREEHARSRACCRRRPPSP